MPSSTMSTEFFSLLGFPARVAGRALLVSRYIVNQGVTVRVQSNYGEQRFGKSVRWRPWLMIDVKELEQLEDLVNGGSDAQIEAWRVSQLSVCGMIAIIGALVASAGLTALQLPSLGSTHYVARGTLIMSVLLAILSVFFSGLQQSSFGSASDTSLLRRWLSSTSFYNTVTLRTEYRSSMVAHMIMQAPFEIVVMSITLFVVGIGVYLGSAWHDHLDLSTGSQADRAVLIAFIVPTVFVLLMYGHMMGLKDRELERLARDGNAPVGVRVKSGRSSADDVEIAAKTAAFKESPVKSLGIEGAELNALMVALKEAAEAHRMCASADEEIARQYERLLQASK